MNGAPLAASPASPVRSPPVSLTTVAPEAPKSFREPAVERISAPVREPGIGFRAALTNDVAPLDGAAMQGFVCCYRSSVTWTPILIDQLRP